MPVVKILTFLELDKKGLFRSGTILFFVNALTT
jgi:hypothetical protein